MLALTRVVEPGSGTSSAGHGPSGSMRPHGLASETSPSKRLSSVSTVGPGRLISRLSVAARRPTRARTTPAYVDNITKPIGLAPEKSGVRAKGLEPPWLAPHGPKPCACTNSRSEEHTSE